jgi:hypothetical protein
MPFGSNTEFKGIVLFVDGFSVGNNEVFIDVTFKCGSTCSLKLNTIKIEQS